VFNIAYYHWRNANQNYNEIPSHLGQNGHLPNAGKGVEKREPSCTVVGNVNWCSYYGKGYGRFLKKLKIVTI